MNAATPCVPSEIADRSVWLKGDIAESLSLLGC